MQVDEYRREFLEDIRARASVASNFTHTEFVDAYAELLSEAEELSDFESCYFRGTGSRNRSLAVDGFAQDNVERAGIEAIVVSGRLSCKHRRLYDRKILPSDPV
jgi:hypothetical protein